MSGKMNMDDEQSEAGSHAEGAAPNAGDAAAVRRSMEARERAGGSDGSALGGDVQARIGQHLRAMYDDVVRQGVPDRFLDLLVQLDQKAGTKPAGGGRDEEAGR